MARGGLGKNKKMKLKKVRKCPVCSGGYFLNIYTEDSVPVILRPLCAEDIKVLKGKNIQKSIPLELGMCRDCAHIFMTKQPGNAFFDDLYSLFYKSHISRMKQTLGVGDINQFVKIFIDKFKKEIKYDKGLKILEIGCFDGYLMSVLAGQGFNPFGCDPSESALIGIESGLNIQRAVFNEDVFKGMSFDCIYSRHVLEHMQAPVSVLGVCSKRLNQDGLVFMEVPNGDYALSQGYVYPFHVEHISTFTSTSLTCAFQKAGFEIVDIHNKDRNLLIVARKHNNALHDMPYGVPKLDETLSLGEQFTGSVLKYKNDLASFIKSNFTRDTKTAIWGAGSVGIRFLNSFAHILDVKPVIVDRAEGKQGLSFYGFPGLVVHDPSYIVENPVEYIIVTSQFYKEILKDIRDIYKLDSKILLVTSQKELASDVHIKLG